MQTKSAILHMTFIIIIFNKQKMYLQFLLRVRIMQLRSETR